MLITMINQIKITNTLWAQLQQVPLTTTKIYLPEVNWLPIRVPYIDWGGQNQIWTKSFIVINSYLG